MDKISLDQTTIFRPASPYQIRLLFRQLVHTSVASLIAAVFITVVLWPVTSHVWLLSWLSLLVIISLGRIYLVHHVWMGKEKYHLDWWRSIAFLLIFMAALLWGALAFVYDYSWPVFYQYAVLSVLFIIALGCIPAYATSLPIYFVSLISILLPITLKFVFSGQSDYLLYGAGLVTLVVLLFAFAWRYHEAVIHEVGEHHGYRDDYTELKTRHDDLSLKLDQKEADEKTARAIYTRIAGLKPIDHDGIKGIVMPQGEFSGDFIYTAKTPEGIDHILFADFSGHGLQAALGAIPVSSIFYSMTAKGLSPEKIIQELDESLFERLATDQFCCACFIAVDSDRKTLRIWNGGIPDVLIANDRRLVLERLSSEHIPLGIEPGKNSNYKLDEIGLISCDTVLVYSDGLIEATNARKESFGQRRVEDLLLTHHGKPSLIDILKRELASHMDGVLPADDISMLMIRC